MVITSDECRWIALYGTLRWGESGYRRLRLEKSLTYVGSCDIAGKLYAVSHYPGLVSGSRKVAADLFEIRDHHVIGLLDRFEGYDPHDLNRSLYLRDIVTLVRPRRQAWVYIYNRPVGDLTLIASGDWKAWKNGRQ